MNKILSQDEVDALLRSINTPADDASQSEATQSSAPATPNGTALVSSKFGAGHQYGVNERVTLYNFRRPDRVPKALLRSLQLLHDKFCSNVSSSLSAYLRVVTEVSLLSVEQTTYAEFLLSLSDPTYFSALSIKPLNGMAALEMNLELVFPIIDRLLGGNGNLPKLTRNITEIEKTIIQGVIKLITSNLADTWRPVTVIDFSFRASETRPQLLQVAAANEVVILIIFEAKLGDARSTMHLCIPFGALEPIAHKFEQEVSIRGKGSVREDLRRVLKTMKKIPLNVTVELAGGMVAVRELLTVQVGDVIKLDGKSTDKVTVQVEGRSRFQSFPTLVNEHKAVRIIETRDAGI
jgi:flagellar motor switch protein FliM